MWFLNQVVTCLSELKPTLHTVTKYFPVRKQKFDMRTNTTVARQTWFELKQVVCVSPKTQIDPSLAIPLQSYLSK